MRKHWLFWLSLAILGPGASAEAQEVEPIFENACPPSGGCDSVCSFDWKPYYEQVVRTHDLLEGADSKTVRLVEYSTTDARLQQMRETWYIRKDVLSGQTAPFYRCKNAAIPDHRDSANPAESASYDCTNLGVLVTQANPWLDAAKTSRTPVGSATSGLLPLRRYLKTGGTDHKTWTSTTPTGYGLNTTFSGTNARLGYERFGKLLDKSQVIGTGESSGYGVHLLENDYMKIEFNRTWGNAIGRITQVGSGRQIVSEPIGDMVQSVLRFNAADPDCRVPNPTQSGGAECVAPAYSVTSRWAGSPVISTSRVGTDTAAPQMFTSVLRPLDFCHNGKNRLNSGGATPAWPGATATEPLAWNGFTERSDTLACRLGTLMRKDVMKTVSRYQLAGNHSGFETQVLALNTHWLKPQELVSGNQTVTEWDFKIYCKNLETGEVRQMLASLTGKTLVNKDDATCGAPAGTTDNSAPRQRHAVIASRTDGTFAYAVARLNLPPGAFTNVSFRCAAGANCNDSTKGTVIIQALTNGVQLSKTQWSVPQESFLVMNTKAIIMDNAVNRLNELNNEFLAGGGVVDCMN